MKRSQIIGWGSYLPKQILTNDELAQRIDTSDEWITSRTGIRQRHIAAEGENTSDLAVSAAQAAIATAGIEATDIDLIIVATATPDNTFPSTATAVQAKLGITQGAAFDVSAVCSGFVFGLTVADNFIRCGQADTVLVIGAEVFSRILDWQDRGTCVLFGDGAGALLLRATESDEANNGRYVLSTHIHSDGRYRDLLYVDGGPSSTQTVGYLRMSGRDVFKHAVTLLAGAVNEALEANDMKSEDIDWLVPHQANKRIMDATQRKLKLPVEKMVVTIDRHANTSAASIPLALTEAANDGRIQPGHIVLVEGMGGGFTWGSAMIRW
ncbi:MAG: beta-ketoacyl-ACP synthase III [Alphaproteobacteria bacterium]|jgi:3-oxoacyl-[acyl-carrier-protein] synthase-3